MAEITVRTAGHAVPHSFVVVAVVVVVSQSVGFVVRSPHLTVGFLLFLLGGLALISVLLSTV